MDYVGQPGHGGVSLGTKNVRYQAEWVRYICPRFLLEGGRRLAGADLPLLSVQQLSAQTRSRWAEFNLLYADESISSVLLWLEPSVQTNRNSHRSSEA